MENLIITVWLAFLTFGFLCGFVAISSYIEEFKKVNNASEKDSYLQGLE